MSDYRARMFTEYSELRKKIENLKEFIVSEKYDKLPDYDRTDLKEQLKHMESYYKVLGRRVSRQCNSA